MSPEQRAQPIMVADRGRAPAGSPAWSYDVLAGPDVLDHLGPELDELAAAAGTPVTARRTWLAAWIRAHRPAGAEAIALRDRSTGRLDGLAALSVAPQGDHDAIAPLGRRQSDRGALPARHPAAAEALAAALVSRLRGRPRPWVLRLGQLPAGDPVAAGVARHLGATASIVPGVPIPKVEFDDATAVEGWLGQGLRKQLRKARNRLATDGVEAAVGFSGQAGEIAVLLGEIERTHRARERHARRLSELESAPGRRFWRAAVVDHAARGEAEVATLRLGGELAAYVVSLLDGDSYRVLDGRCSTAWARYSPGRLLEAATLERALGDGRFARVDWMNGCASEKLLAANAADHTEHLVAASPGLVVDLDDVTGGPPAGAAPDGDPTVVTLASGAR